MHEEAVLRDLRRKLEEIARTEGVTRISRVRIRVGALCHISPDTLRSRWPLLVAESSASGATLEIESSPDPQDPHSQDVTLLDVGVIDSVPSRPHGSPHPSAVDGPDRSRGPPA